MKKRLGHSVIVVAVLSGFSVVQAQSLDKVNDGAIRAGEFQLTNFLAQVRRPRRPPFALMPVSTTVSTTAPAFSLNSMAAAASLPVRGGGTLGRLTKWTGFTSSNSVVGDSTIFEDKFGKVGIGTDSPTSRLSVAGLIQSLSGGFKFPDGTVQTTAGLSSIPVPLVLSGDVAFGDAVIRGTTTGDGFGAIFTSDNGTGMAAVGAIFAVTGTTTSGIGVLGSSSSGTGVVGQGGLGIGVRGTGVDAGVRGEGPSVGVSGESGDGEGVSGTSENGRGVSGFSTNGPGVRGRSDTNNAGVVGESFSGSGVFAFSNSGTAVNALSIFGRAGDFSGDVDVSGTLTKGGGSFKIDHPLDPENKYLYHSFVESPDMMNVYNGNVVTDAAGIAVVELPAYFGALNRDFRYQLTVIGQFAQAIVAEKIKDNRFVIHTSVPGVEVSWQVTGIRRDSWAERNRIQVEVDKPEKERGHYLHHKAYDQPEEKSVHAARYPELMKQMKELREEAGQKNR